MHTVSSLLKKKQNYGRGSRRTSRRASRSKLFFLKTNSVFFHPFKKKTELRGAAAVVLRDAGCAAHRRPARRPRANARHPRRHRASPPYSLLPAPYSLLHAPCTLHPTSYSLLLEVHSLNPTPYSLLTAAPCSLLGFFFDLFLTPVDHRRGISKHIVT